MRKSGLVSAAAIAARKPAPPPPTSSTSWEDVSMGPQIPRPILSESALARDKSMNPVFRADVRGLKERPKGQARPNYQPINFTAAPPMQSGGRVRGRRREPLFRSGLHKS